MLKFSLYIYMQGVTRYLGIKKLLENKFPILNEDLHDDVSELDVHDCSNRLFLGLEQGGSEAYTQVGYSHQILN